MIKFNNLTTRISNLSEKFHKLCYIDQMYRFLQLNTFALVEKLPWLNETASGSGKTSASSTSAYSAYVPVIEWKQNTRSPTYNHKDRIKNEILLFINNNKKHMFYKVTDNF